ncbi:MAG: hypothetical protein AAF292_00885 [Pseudomonadota bacterium]
MSVLAPVIGYWRLALIQGRLPARRSKNAAEGQPLYRHISGTAAFWIIGFLALIVAISAWATIVESQPTISGWFGIAVIALLLVLFFWFAQYSYKPGQPTSDSAKHAGLMRGLGDLFSKVDSWLVFPIANSAGMALQSPYSRHAVLISVLIPSAILAWYLPKALAFVPLAWALIVILAIARQWSWVEEDREVAMLNRSFDPKDLRIGFAQDQRDEALIGFAAMLLIIPVALRAVFLWLEPSLEYSPNETQNRDLQLNEQPYWVWLSLFGTELAKAVPFVDWAEIFDVQGAPFINLDEEQDAYQWVIFAMRVIVDLVLLGALVQAISIVSRTTKQRQMFFEDGTLARLDPFVEKVELRYLARGRPKDWYLRDDAAFEKFPPYDEDVLVRLSLPTSSEESEDDRMGAEVSPIRFIARKLIARNEARPPEYLLLLQVRKKESDEDAIERLTNEIEQKHDRIDVDQLQRILEYLNRDKKLLDVRKTITRILGLNTSLPNAVQGLIQVLVGSGLAAQDSRMEVREIALQALRLPASMGNQLAQSAIAEAAQRDPSTHVQAVANGILSANEHWFELEAHARTLISNDREADP